MYTTRNFREKRDEISRKINFSFLDSRFCHETRKPATLVGHPVVRANEEMMPLYTHKNVPRVAFARSWNQILLSMFAHRQWIERSNEIRKESNSKAASALLAYRFQALLT